MQRRRCLRLCGRAGWRCVATSANSQPIKSWGGRWMQQHLLLLACVVLGAATACLDNVCTTAQCDCLLNQSIVLCNRRRLPSTSCFPAVTQELYVDTRTGPHHDSSTPIVETIFCTMSSDDSLDPTSPTSATNCLRPCRTWLCCNACRHSIHLE